MNKSDSQQQIPRYRSSSVDVSRSANRSSIPINSRNNVFEHYTTGRQSRSTVRMMNHDFTSKTKLKYQNEIDAAREAIEKDLYISYRQPGKDFDCYRIGLKGKCFCGHILNEHEKYTGITNHLKCQVINCECENFIYIPSRQDEVSEFWLTKRLGFDISTWYPKCKCNHEHNRHEPKSKHCKECNCNNFTSNFLCAVCNTHWEEHKTFFENANQRQQQNLPIKESYLPFSEPNDTQQMTTIVSNTHVPSPYLDTASKRTTIGFNSSNNKTTIRGPLRVSHRATEE